MKILYQDVDITESVSVNQCYHDMYAEKHADELVIRFNDTRRLWDGWQPKPDDTIAVVDGAAKTGKMFVESLVPENGLQTLRAFSTPATVRDKRGKSWETVWLLQLAQEIATRHGLILETYEVTDQVYEYVNQANISDFAFLQQRCTLEGLGFLVYDGKLVLYDEAAMEAQAPVKELAITPGSTFEYTDNALAGFGSVEVKNGGFVGTFTAPNSLSKVLTRVLKVQISSQAEADRYAKALLRDANKGQTTGVLWADAIMREYAPGSVIMLRTEGAGSWNGPAFVTRLRHDYVARSSKLFFRRPLEGY